MKDTTSSNTEKRYLVSFGNSSQYILHDTSTGKDSLLTRIEGELNDYLREKFPDEAFAYFTSPKVKEILNPSDYEGYAPLDDKAVADIKRVLDREIENLESQTSLDADAPFANVNPAAADIPHILG